MRCAIVIPAWSPEDIFPAKTAAVQINYWEPLGTLYVATAIKNAGHNVKFLNGAFMTHEEILANLRDYRPGFVGLYSTTFGWDKANKTASDIKKAIKNVFIAVGGPYPIAMKGACLKEAGDIDAVVTGEGEITIVELLARLDENRSLSEVDGIAYRINGDIKENRARKLIDNLDSVPFPHRELLGDSGKYIPAPAAYRKTPVALIITSRGCDRKCIFCFQIDKNRANKIRYRSIDNVLDEIELCLAQGYKEIKFIDDTLCADYKRALALAEGIIERQLDFTWFASAVVNQVDGPLLRAFKKAGCWAILFGAESGVQKNLNTIKKGITLEQTRQAVSMAKKAGLTVFTSFVFGIPGETFEDGLKTIEFACDLNPHFANFHALTPFPGCELYDHADKYGSVSKNLADYTYQGAAFAPETMSRDDIMRLRQTAFKRFYSRPLFILRQIARLRTLHDARAAFTGLKSLRRIWMREDMFGKKADGKTTLVSSVKVE
ncbi:Cobalamin B12-binding:Radical SAM [hydrothermal vent metagenome]|uniref:Cobalamin B12-binding:Radical SAM n=1 Tax=hydrothermal vent metagenome TaxID=652676 RepID=A0A3B1C9Y2_9ZZZZ